MSGGSDLKNFVEIASAMNPRTNHRIPRVFDRLSKLIHKTAHITAPIIGR